MGVMAAAIDEARRLGLVHDIGPSLDLPGYRRRLAGRFQGWTRDERRMDGAPPGDSAIDAEEWAIFGAYRDTLRQLDAEDPAGWAVWASTRLAKQPPPELRKPGQVVVVAPISLDRAAWRVLDHANQNARSMTVCLPFDPDPALAELYATADDMRRQFLGWGFVEEAETRDLLPYRPAGLLAVERELFRTDAHQRPKLRLDPARGLKILGGPRGDGVGLLVAREVRSLLGRAFRPEEILVLVPRFDADAERVREVMRSWGLPVARATGGRLSKIPAVSALRSALRLPVDGWEAASLVRLLRNGQVAFPDLERFGRFEAASAIHASRTFRDRQSLEQALAREDRDPRGARERAVALSVVRQVGAAIDSAAGPGPWPVQVERARRIAADLGLDLEALEPLWDALDDHGWVIERLGTGDDQETMIWGDFVRTVESIITEVDGPASRPAPGTIRIEEVREAAGARARGVILANLAEGTFPAPGTIDLDAVGTEGDRMSPAYSAEMLRFAGVSGSAEECLVLAYPTTDVNGETLLPAGFLDDLMRRLEGGVDAPCIERHARFDPVLLDREDLAKSPADARVRAVALAAQGRDDGPLRSLAGRAEHRSALIGVADAFQVASRRRGEIEFGPYDGMLRDAAAIQAIRRSFGPDHPFSPSQLESFALCPFQFYQRYVLGLERVDDRRELDEDYAGRGSAVHDTLEQIHQQMHAEQPDSLIDRLPILIRSQVRIELSPDDGEPASVPDVLREIGERRTQKALLRYVDQFRAYAGGSSGVPDPHGFEVVFGQKLGQETPAPLPHLTLGEEASSVKLQGKIDRIDVFSKEGRLVFRVIDYKTGSNPPSKEVVSGLASQLPLYALAVEQLVFPDGTHEFGDVGYWSLPKDGFKAVKIGEWPAYRGRLIAFVVAMVSRLREGQFPIHSMKKDCRKFCDFHAACRVGEVRMTGKNWVERPIMITEEER
jgi:hypothetical protein